MPKKKLSFDQFDIPHLEEVLPAIERVFRENGIDFFILGALARDMHFLRENVRPLRMTKDIDVAVFIPHPPDFERLMKELEDREGFSRSKDNPARIFHPTGLIVDVLPFDELSSSGASMERFGPAFADFNLKGLHEVFSKSTDEVFLGEENRYKVTTPEAIILLKFFAYNDKPEWRQKDIEDIGQLLKHYFDLNDNDIYENHNDLFEEEAEKPLEIISARVIGRKIAHFLDAYQDLKNEFIKILNDHLKKGEESKTALLLSQEMRQPVEAIIQCLTEMVLGLEEFSR